MLAASLFTGIGGFELGLSEEGITTVVATEVDLAAQDVLADRFPNLSIVADVEDLTASQISSASLLTGGFPCQDVSIVGGQRGLGGEKSGLVRHVFRLAEASRPDWILLENVQSIRYVHGGRVLAYLMHEAERLGYSWAYRTLDSRYFNLPQRRRRFYFVASRVADPGTILFSGGEAAPLVEQPSLDRPIGFYWTEGRAGHGLTVDAIPTLKAGSTIGIPSPPAVLFPDGSVKVPTIETAERLQGFPKGWTEAAPARDRWRLVGNAVSPPVLRWIGERFKTPIAYASPKHELPTSKPWPLAAWGDGKGKRYLIEAGEAPDLPQIGRLSEHPDFTWQPISKRALRGFTTRARDSRLHYPDHFLDRLEQFLPDAV
ncbi:DNA cytosine methyltransferase [Microvirga sp. CF3016]|uniref:DNA cytosine methyltransferase n=1 Tax=Microvirga sp. CF3016 TaxID=3110181 RepID=UPI002E75ACAE|nr:DNA (cytosine-5-)-methyltransferase [Microvirga sp. CF3016]MEE1611867.1 DNA (cytosine-5-)-methyltransferase [Microvirga sp. CF3016]